MAVSGPRPKPRDQIRHRVPPAREWTEVENTPYGGPVPKLPPRYRTTERGARVRAEWPARTRAWWSVVSVMPHCLLWSEADWQFALDTAECHARFTEGANGTELRIRARALGTTSDALQSLRIRYVEPRQTVADVIPIDRRERFLDL